MREQRFGLLQVADGIIKIAPHLGQGDTTEIFDKAHRLRAAMTIDLRRQREEFTIAGAEHQCFDQIGIEQLFIQRVATLRPEGQRQAQGVGGATILPGMERRLAQRRQDALVLRLIGKGRGSRRGLFVESNRLAPGGQLGRALPSKKGVLGHPLRLMPLGKVIGQQPGHTRDALVVNFFHRRANPPV